MTSKEGIPKSQVILKGKGTGGYPKRPFLKGIPKTLGIWERGCPNHCDAARKDGQYRVFCYKSDCSAGYNVHCHLINKITLLIHTSGLLKLVYNRTKIT